MSKKKVLNEDNIKGYLMDKGENHSHYRVYGKIDRIKDIVENKVIYLGTGENWNDILDRENINSPDYDYIQFAKCFSYSTNESVAMWMLYGGRDKKGGCVDFTRKGIEEILNVREIAIGYFDKVNDKYTFIEKVKLSQDSFKIGIYDVAYYTQNDNKYSISRDYDRRTISEIEFKQLLGISKLKPWEYEKECRLIISVKKELVANYNATDVKIDLKKMNLGKSLKRFYHSPNFPVKEESYNSKPSMLGDNIDWNIE